MTTENSVRVPRAAIAELLGGTRDEIDEMAKRTGYSRFPSPEQLRGWRCVIDSAIHHLAAPAPAGSLPEQGANPCKCIDCGGTEPGHSPDCTFMAELHSKQVAGLAEPAFEVCAGAFGAKYFNVDMYEIPIGAKFYSEQQMLAALARQQSRGVDREMSGRLGDHLREKHGVMLSTQSLQAALRAALGDRDGR